MRFIALVLCVAATGLTGIPVRSALAQSTGPATDKVDISPVDAAKTDNQPSPPAPPDTAPPPSVLPPPGPPEQAPPPPETAQKPADMPAPAENVETVGPGQAISILGKKVVGPDGKAILGSVIDMLVDAEGKPRAAVIDFGGFLGVGSRHVAIDWNSLKFRLDDHDAPVQLDLDPAAIRAAPEYKEVGANAEVVEPALSSPEPLPAIAPLPELPIDPIEPQAPPTRMHSTKNAGQ